MTPAEIKSRMKEMKLTQKKMAKRLNRSETAINFIIHGKLQSERLETRFAKVLGVTLEELHGIPATEEKGAA